MLAWIQTWRELFIMNIYILKSCKTKQTWGSVNFWCSQETTETLLYVLANGSLRLL